MHMTMLAFTRKRQRHFMTDIFCPSPLCQNKRYGFSVPNSGSFLGSFAPDGMALSESRQCLHMAPSNYRTQRMALCLK